MATRQTTEQQRLHIIESIDNLLYQKGFNAMSFSDISTVTGLSKGNLYYYFKTKEDILKAVIDHRITEMRNMLLDWDNSIPTPIERLQRFTKIAINESENVIHFGCPMGSLNTELAKSQPTLQKITKQQFDVFKTWLKKQFKLFSPQQNSDILAKRLLIRTQGVVVISQTYKDKKIITREIEEINQWLLELNNN